MHITEVRPMTVQNILNEYTETYMERDTLTGRAMLDDYHLLIIEAAFRLNRNGLSEFTYYTGWGSATQWISPDSGYVIVHADGTLS